MLVTARFNPHVLYAKFYTWSRNLGAGRVSKEVPAFNEHPRSSATTMKGTPPVHLTLSGHPNGSHPAPPAPATTAIPAPASQQLKIPDNSPERSSQTAFRHQVSASAPQCRNSYFVCAVQSLASRQALNKGSAVAETTSGSETACPRAGPRRLVDQQSCPNCQRPTRPPFISLPWGMGNGACRR